MLLRRRKVARDLSPDQASDARAEDKNYGPDLATCIERVKPDDNGQADYDACKRTDEQRLHHGKHPSHRSRRRRQ
jgi:hypothetical protein